MHLAFYCFSIVLHILLVCRLYLCWGLYPSIRIVYHHQTACAVQIPVNTSSILGIFTFYGGKRLVASHWKLAGADFGWFTCRLKLSWFATDNEPIVVFCLLGYSWPFSANELQISWFTNYPFQHTPRLIYIWLLFSFVFLCSDCK